MKIKNMISLILFTGLLQIGCDKEYLDLRQNKALTVPSTFADFQGLLDYSSVVMNYAPGLQMVCVDDFYLEGNGLQNLSSILEQNAYTWAADIYQGLSLSDWNRMYQQVFYANVVLDGLQKMNASQQSDLRWKQLMGAALFHRAISYYHLAQLFATPYVKGKADFDLGIPLRKNSDLNQNSQRGKLQQTYDQILSDLLLAKDFLPVDEVILTRPTQNAAYAILARIYLTMGNYGAAEEYADKSLLVKRELVDYNTLNSLAVRPFPVFLPDNKNPEVIFYSRINPYSYFNSSLTFVDPALYESYKQQDMRKQIFFSDKGNGRFAYKGSYTGNSVLFGGIAINEVYLIKAEAAARNGKSEVALTILNTLLAKRFKSGNFHPYKTSDGDVLSIVTQERRKELIGTSSRWSDLRRLNLEPNFAISLIRNVNGTIFTLPPNDPKYVFAIPDNEILLNGVEQNIR